MATHQFDSWQREAIALAGGRHLVLAPPGCGKTDILAERVVHAREQGVEYADMLCLTFTNRAAKGMALRIADRTQNPVPDALFVGNIHRYCSQLLFTAGLVNHNCAIIDEKDVDNIIKEELGHKLGIECRHSTEVMRVQHAFRQHLLGHPSEVVLHGELLSTGAVVKVCNVLGLMGEDRMAYLYDNIFTLMNRYDVLREMPAARTLMLAHAYEQYKEEHDLIDYDDLLVLTYQHLPSLLAEGRAHRYKWIEVDEVQDLNALQIALIEELADEAATVVYLGDEQQAIFSFIGAKLDTLEQLKQRCAGHIHHLYTNYRSPHYLLAMQNDYAICNLGIPAEVLPTTNNHQAARPEDICLLDVGDGSLEAYYTVRFARRYAEVDPDGRVAILVSTNREADEVSQVMGHQGIAHFKISGADLFSLPAVRLVLAHMSVLTDENVFIAWARLLWGLKIVPSYSAARALMHDMRAVGLLPTDFLLYPCGSYVQQFMQAYEQEELVIFDTETTGLDPLSDDIIQIAAIRVKQGRVVGRTFNVILETERELPLEVGGHRNPMIDVYNKSRRLKRADGLKKFLEFSKGCILVGHNVEYDYRILAANLQRDLGRDDIGELYPRYFDTLKYIRLVRPRLRRYKLGHLLEVLHLEGSNSHQADDDIMATLSLLNFCHANALTMVEEQRLFLIDHISEAALLRERYGTLYAHGREACRDSAPPYEGKGVALSGEMDFAYRSLLADGLIDEVDKWPHLLRYVATDMVRDELFPTLRQQLERYYSDLNTSKEADMCGASLEEQFVISTVHKAKGLEFDTVVIYQAIDGCYPSSRSLTEKAIQEDARRLFVALSRAKRHLCVVYHTHVGSNRHWMSPFIAKIKQHFTHYVRMPDGKIRTIQEA